MEKALSLAYRYLAYRPRTVEEVRRKLQTKAERYLFTQQEIDAVLELLKDQGYLNDLEFIKSFVNSRGSLKPKSQRVLTLELRKAGVTQSDIDTYFLDSPINETEAAEKALKKKLKSLNAISDGKKRFSKAISFLQRRGFSYNLAKRAYLQLTGQ